MYFWSPSQYPLLSYSNHRRGVGDDPFAILHRISGNQITRHDYNYSKWPASTRSRVIVNTKIWSSQFINTLHTSHAVCSPTSLYRGNQPLHVIGLLGPSATTR